jgi:glycosyltransferase involved in cell wall biosynthesis
VKITFFCGRSAEEWAPPILNTTGIGGSETAVVKIAALFARDGWLVDVFGNPGRHEGVYDGVGYWDAARLRPGETTDVLVSWRQPQRHDLPVDAKARLLWLHDHNGGDAWAEHLPKWDRVLGVSGYHRDFLAEAYGLSNADYVPNGIDLGRFDPTVRKKPFQAVYASSPDRGLLTLLDLWPRIATGVTGTQEKDARLVVAYGFDTMDKWINAGRHDLGAFKDACLAKMKATPGVEYVGRLPQDRLAKVYAESYAWLYPSDFLETSCISAMEAMAGGAVPVVSSAGALKETVGDGGLVVYGPNGTRSNPYSPAWRDFYVNCARTVLFEANTRKTLEAKARARAQAYTWDAAYERWQTIVGEVLT